MQFLSPGPATTGRSPASCGPCGATIKVVRAWSALNGPEPGQFDLSHLTVTLLGQSRCDLSLQTVNRVFERTADALSKIAPEVLAYFKNTAAHPDVGDRLLSAWDAGIKHSLGFAAHSIAM